MPKQTLRLVLRPNRSLSARGLGQALLVVVAGPALAAAVFLARGAWPIALMLGLELALIIGVFRLLRRRLGDCETIQIDDDRLRIVQRRGGREQAHEFQRYWARVALLPVLRGRHPSRLVIRSHGREAEIGAAFREEERRALARDLAALVGPAGSGRTLPQRFEFSSMRGALQHGDNRWTSS